MKTRRLWLVCCLIAGISVGKGICLADGPQDNIPENVRPVPPVGIELKPEVQKSLLSSLDSLDSKIGKLKERKEARVAQLLPDIEIYSRAIRQNIEHRELFADRDVKSAEKVLEEGHRRADALEKLQAPWTTETGLVVRGFRSKIDQTVQPYGLEIPHDYSFGAGEKFRLDVWLHGRGERVSETLFLHQRMNRPGQYQPKQTIVLHPYGRYCNAFKFAGEIDILEAIDHVHANYGTDENKVAIRGFSMGGAGCWQMAVHYPDRFFAANPGAGFSETPEFLKSFQSETLDPTWFEKKLWRWYDCPGYAANLTQLPTVAYSGELDIQKQAADVMEAALAERGIRMVHLIGPETKHSIHADSKVEITKRLDQIASQVTAAPSHRIRFETFTLRYDRCEWVRVTGLESHWEQGQVDATLDPANNAVTLKLSGVSGVKLHFDSGACPLNVDSKVSVRIESIDRRNGVKMAQRILVPGPMSDRSWEVELKSVTRGWTVGEQQAGVLKKKHGLQGPIDDAFMDSFIVVAPTGKAWHPEIQKWSAGEQEHFVKEWRRQFRGDAIIVNDADVTPEMVASSNLILFGDPSSNQYLSKIIEKLPFKWTEQEVSLGGQTHSSADHAPVLVYPNPENQERYVVLNSGFTYREYAYLNNARQVPKLPDWALIDVRVPANSLWPGKVVAADFFDEIWQVRSK